VVPGGVVPVAVVPVSDGAGQFHRFPCPPEVRMII